METSLICLHRVWLCRTTQNLINSSFGGRRRSRPSLIRLHPPYQSLAVVDLKVAIVAYHFEEIPEALRYMNRNELFTHVEPSVWKVFVFAYFSIRNSISLFLNIVWASFAGSPVNFFVKAYRPIMSRSWGDLSDDFSDAAFVFVSPRKASECHECNSHEHFAHECSNLVCFTCDY